MTTISADSAQKTPGAALIEGIFVLEKMPGKGGWTFVKLPGSVRPTVESLVRSK